MHTPDRQLLSKLGFELNEIAVDPERVNLAAVLKGTGGGRSLLFNGHVDTVAPFKPENWSSGDPWKPVRQGEDLIGLGSADMKGGLTAACLAMAALCEAGIRLNGELQHPLVSEEKSKLSLTECKAGARLLMHQRAH